MDAQGDKSPSSWYGMRIQGKSQYLPQNNPVFATRPEVPGDQDYQATHPAITRRKVRLRGVIPGQVSDRDVGSILQVAPATAA